MLGAVSALLYLTMLAAQRAIFLNGLAGLDRGVSAYDAGILRWGVAPDTRRAILQLCVYYGTTLALVAIYVAILWTVRGTTIWSRQHKAALLAFPILFNIMLLPGWPAFSQDAYTYVAYGSVGNEVPGNPYATTLEEIERTEVGRELSSWGWRPLHPPVPYGPLWTATSQGIGKISEGERSALLMHKAVAFLAVLACAWLIWNILGRVRPIDQLLGTVAFLWNPVVIAELAGEGHNDPLMIVWVLASLLASVARRPAGSLVSLALGILVKFVPVFFGLAHLAYYWRNRREQPSQTRSLGVGAVLAATLIVALFTPYWIGLDTFDGLRGGGRVVLNSNTFAVGQVLDVAMEESTAYAISQALFGVVFLALVITLSLRVRSMSDLLVAYAAISLAYVTIGSSLYWPWYISMPLALMALTPRGVFFWTIVAATIGSRLVAPFAALEARHFLDFRLGIVFTIALGVWLPLAVLAYGLVTRGSILPPEKSMKSLQDWVAVILAQSPRAGSFLGLR